MPQDKSLQMNQTIETAILQLQQSPTPEQLAHTLTVVRRCMQAGGQWIVAVEPVPGGGQVQPRVVTTADGASWWYAFTSFEEQMKSPDTVKSTFLADIDKLFAAAVRRGNPPPRRQAAGCWQRPCRPGPTAHSSRRIRPPK